MRSQIFAIASLFAISASAVPHAGHEHRHLHHRQATSATATSVSPSETSTATPSQAPSGSSSGGDTFMITIDNQCSTDLEFGIFAVSASFAMETMGNTVNIAAGGTGAIAAPFTGIGMRLSGTASQGAAAQWAAQPLFEFGYSEYSGQTGTAYDLSIMEGSVPSNVGLAVVPENGACPAKKCTPTSCPLSQGWTNPDQVNVGSPADTVCYQGKTNFRVTWCA